MTRYLVALVVSLAVLLCIILYSEAGREIPVSDRLQDELKGNAKLTVYGWPLAKKFVLSDRTISNRFSSVTALGMQGADKTFLSYPNQLDRWISRSTIGMNQVRWAAITGIVFFSLVTWDFWHERWKRFSLMHIFIATTFFGVLIWVSNPAVNAISFLQLPVSFGLCLVLIEPLRWLLVAASWLGRVRRSGGKRVAERVSGTDN